MNPARMGWIIERLARAHRRDLRAPRLLAGLRVLDVGCGAGLASEVLARAGANVTGLDAAAEALGAARAHAARGGLAIEYREGTPEALLASGEGRGGYDAVLALEVVEHVADLPAFLAALATVVRPGGIAVLSTLSRTASSFAQAIVAAEYLLGWLPRGTHRWRSFLTPAELARHLRRVGMRPLDVQGVGYRADRQEFHLSRSPDVNYFMTAAG
jgi:2-polyprenyl-6-hydroxyphenyl methylase/3-demethylubiquinone-9 3-methyltransferase